ncbi:hypothetical protein Zmor_016506 [Zophobas morio]|uniref:MD-2-related lipid-recognition domain-containing protein n=1 Tax=Zophobas morio TaxID=2755281 RepID=A0AA38I7F8_9CUCU|nr:hypothetical protein Zmor_016506 [Zophobas morio]
MTPLSSNSAQTRHHPTISPTMLKPTICLIPLILLTNQAFIKNKYTIEVDNVEVCPNNDQLKNPIRNLKYVRYNRTQRALNFDFTYDRPIDEKVGGCVTIDRWGDGGWKQVPFLGFQPDMCKSMLTYFKTAWVSFHTKAGVGHADRCPVPAGNYSLRDYVIDTSGINIPFWNGRFRFSLQYVDSKTKDVILCYVYYVKIAEVF